MAGSTSETVRTVTVDGTDLDVVGYYDSDTNDTGFDFFDVFDTDGACLNVGAPFFEPPFDDEVADLLRASAG